MKNFVHKGLILTLIPPYSGLSGTGMKTGNLFGVAAGDFTIAVASEFNVAGVFDLAKDGSAFAQGALIYWDDVTKSATSTVGANLLIGAAEVAAIAGDATVRIRLFGVPGFSGQAHGVCVAHALYVGATDGLAQGAITPAISDTIPDNAVVVGGVVNSYVAVTSNGNATVAIGTAAGSAANSILTATAKATLTLDAVVVPTCQATPFKMTAAGKIDFTVATADLLTGTIEAWVFYFPANG